MRFKLRRTEVVVSFSVFALFLLSTVADGNEILLSSFIASVAHELVHLVFILMFGGTVSVIKFSFFGGDIKQKNTGLSSIKEAVISLSAPLFNIMLGLIMLSVSDNSATGYVNLLVGLFNLLPYYSFDGGRGMYYILCDKLSQKVLNNVLNALSIGVIIFMTIIATIICRKYQYNIFLIAVVVSMYFSLIYRLFKQSEQL